MKPEFNKRIKLCAINKSENPLKRNDNRVNKKLKLISHKSNDRHHNMESIALI